MTLAQANKLREATGLQQALKQILDIHRADFPSAIQPIAPETVPPDAQAILSELTASALRGIGLFNRSARRTAKQQAARDAEAHVLRDAEERRRRREEYQAELNDWWNRLISNDADVVFQTLAKALEDNDAAAAPIGVSGSEATLVVLVPHEDAVPNRAPSTTAAGNLSVKKMTKKEHDAFYTLLVCGYILVTVKEALAVARGLTHIRVIAVRSTGVNAYGAQKGEALMGALFARNKLADVRWDKADAGTIVNDASDELAVNYKGVNQTISPLNLTKEPEIRAVLDAVSFEELTAND